MTMPSAADLLSLVILPIPVASISWTCTHEEIFREPREWLKAKSTSSASWWKRKFLYALTCEYCFSHYVTAFVVFIMRFQLFFPDWRGYFVSGFSVVWIANFYMSLYGRVRLDIKRERVEIAAQEEAVSTSNPAVNQGAERARKCDNGSRVTDDPAPGDPP